MALSQIDNVSLNLGQGYIIDSFMVVNFGGVNLWGTLVGAFSLGIVSKFPPGLCRRGARQDRGAGAHHLVIQKRPLQPVCARGPDGGSDRRARALGSDRRVLVTIALLVATAVAVLPVTAWAFPPTLVSHPALYRGAGRQNISATRCLRSLDLVWGFAGILSLGHGAFSPSAALRDGHVSDAPDRRQQASGNPIRLVFLNYKRLPWFWRISTGSGSRQPW